MVTPQGFNALLKLVEEPPDHVKFIFATTEPEKVIGTIRSRTHHYPFRLVPPEQMLDYVQRLCVSEKVEVQPGVLSLVVRAGGGSVRDTLSLLDQLIAGSDPSAGSGVVTVEYERAVALLGYTHGALLDEVVDALGAMDAAAAFFAVDRVIQTGQDPRRFVEDLLERLRDLIVVAATRDGAAAVLRGTPQDELDRMSQQAVAFGAAELSRAADVVNASLTEMTGATSPRLHLELMVARMLLPSADDSDRGALARVERLERRIGISAGSDSEAPARRDAGAGELSTGELSTGELSTAELSSVEPILERGADSAEPPSAEPPGSEPVAPAAPVTLQQLRDAWPEILEVVQKSKRSAWMVVYTATPRVLDGDVLTLSFPSETDVASFKERPTSGGSVSEQLRSAIVTVLGIRVKFVARVDAAAAASSASAPAEPAESQQAAPATWNVTPIPGSEEAPPPEDEPAPPAEEQELEPEPESGVDATPSDPTAADVKPARYGEAVVREILGASFIEEQDLAPRDRPVTLPSGQTPGAGIGAGAATEVRNDLGPSAARAE